LTQVLAGCDSDSTCAAALAGHAAVISAVASNIPKGFMPESPAQRFTADNCADGERPAPHELPDRWTTRSKQAMLGSAYSALDSAVDADIHRLSRSRQLRHGKMLKLQGCVCEITEGVQDSDIAGRFGPQHIHERLVAVLHDGGEDLDGDD